MNKAFLIGNLTKDPELKTTPNGIAVCTFTVAVKREMSKDKQTDFIPIVAWRGLAENCGKYLTKGKQCAVSGSIQTRNYEAKDGTKRYLTEIVADDVQFLGSKTETGIAGITDEPDDDDLPF